MKLLLKGGRVVDPVAGRDGEFDILIEDDRVSKIGKSLPADGAEVMEIARGWIVAPGLIDIHVHLREPGQEHKETIATGTLSAVAGGFTAVACMPNTDPVNDHPGVTELICRRAAEASRARVYPIGAVSIGSKGEQMAELAAQKAAGCVAFTDDGHPVASALLMRRALEYASMLGVPIVNHCEDPSLKGDGVAHEGLVASRLGLRGIPGVAESIMVERDIALAELTGGLYHVCHMSARQSLRAVRAAKARGMTNVTCEVAPHHFVLTDEALETPIRYDTNVKMNPPLREAADRNAMLEGIADGFDRRHRHGPRAASRRRETGRVRSRAVRHRRARDMRAAGLRASGACRAHSRPQGNRTAVGQSGAHLPGAGRDPRRGRAGRHHGARAGRAGDHPRRRVEIEIEEHAVRRLAAARRRGRHHRRRTHRLQERGIVSRIDDLRRQALKQLEQFEVLMRNGHFDYGNGFHGRVYLNAHQLFRHPSTIWRLAQDLLDVLPGELLEKTEVVAGPVMGGALLAHTLAGLLDGRRALTHPPCSFAPFSGGGDSDVGLRAFYAREMAGKRVLIADDVRNTGKTLQRCAELVREAGGTVLATVQISDRMEAIADAGVPNYALAEYKAPENVAAADCPMCLAGEPITSF